MPCAVLQLQGISLNVFVIEGRLIVDSGLASICVESRV